MDYTPDHLNEYTIEIGSLKGFPESKWFEGLSCRLKLNYLGDNYFKIITNGILCDDGFIISPDESPLKISAQCLQNKEQIILFDEAVHGYTHLLIEENIYSSANAEEYVYTDKSGDDLFEVYIWANSSVDFEDEFSFDNENKVKLLNGQSVDIDYLKRNAFDAFGIILRNQNQEYIILTEMELS